MIRKMLGLATAALTASAGVVALTAAPAHADGELGRVISKTRLTVRHAPSTHSNAVTTVKPGTKLPLNCKVTGTTVDGNNRWYLLLGSDYPEWVSARYIDNIGAAPDWCGNDERFVGRATRSVRVRVGPNTRDRAVDTLAHGEGVDIICKAKAQNIDGNNRWYWTKGKRWVSARYIDNVGRAPNWCVGM